ncbi:MAG: hypothetical protein WC490_02550 [Candidatus Margulisiibacteriota bacterium]
MVKIPGSIPAPIVPPNQPKKTEQTSEAAKSKAPERAGVSREPFQMDSQGLAVRMAALAQDAKEREISFDEVIQKAIKETGLSEPQAAMEEANRKLQKEIEDELDKIKSNKDLMEEAQAWQGLADILEHELSEDQVKGFLSILDQEIKGIHL